MTKHAFISYRRKTGLNFANNVVQSLRELLGKKVIFQDHRDIHGGTDVRTIIQDAIQNSFAVVVLIDKEWFSDENLARLHDNDDYIRFEILQTLRRKIPVIPVFEGVVSIPDRKLIPPELHPLFDLAAIAIRGDRPDPDIKYLADLLRKHRPNKWLKISIAGAIAVVVLLAGLLVHRMLPLQDNGSPPLPIEPSTQLDTLYFASGYMGAWGPESNPHLAVKKTSGKLNGDAVAVTEIVLTPGASEPWAGLYWQYPDKNWGEEEGRNLTGYRKITFFARGAKGGEIVKFLSGDIKGLTFEDTHFVSQETVLSNTWTQYTMDLAEQDLTNVIGAFAFSISLNDNDGEEVTFYLASIMLE